MSSLIRSAITLLAVMFTTTAFAQSWPSHPIKLILPFPPGGATDTIARTVGTPLGARLGQQIVIDNRPGSNGNIAAEIAANSHPDGYTLFLGSDATFGINPHLYKNMPIDPNKAFVPVTNLVSNQLVLTVNPAKVPVKDFKEFIAFAKKAKPPLFYASIGNGSQHHLAMEMLKRDAGINLTHVPYKGGGPAGIATVSGETAAMFGGGSVVSLVKSGKLHALAVTSKTRSPVLPDVPTIAEFYPGYEVNIWQGLFAPTGTPKEILERLRTEVNIVLAQPEVAQRLMATGSGEPSITTPEQFEAMIHSAYENYGKVIKDIGLKIDN